MKKKSFFVIINLFLMLLLITPTYGRTPEPNWSVRLDPSNNNRIEVIFDAVNSKDYIYKEVSFSVRFYDNQKKLIKKESFDFTHNGLRRLDGGVRHRRFITHEVNSAATVIGNRLKYKYTPFGLEQTAAPKCWWLWCGTIWIKDTAPINDSFDWVKETEQFKETIPEDK